jgi:ribonuclease III
MPQKPPSESWTYPRPDLLEDFEQRIGHRFSRPERLLEALCHPSYTNEQAFLLPNFERLEFLGDAALGLVVTEHLLLAFPELAEWELNKLRQRLVSGDALVPLARTWRLEQVLLLGVGERKTGGAERASNLEDAAEAVLGALFLDGGIEACKVALAPWLEPAAALAWQSEDINFKSVFQEMVQAAGAPTPSYLETGTEGPDNARVHHMAVLVDEVKWGRGSGTTKARAGQAAAREAILAWRKSRE